MTPADLARIHAASFTYPRPWSETEFTELLKEGRNFLIGDLQGFVMGRVLLDEAELLTIAVAPTARRAGRGRSLLSRFEGEALQRGATAAFLEVAEGNLAAHALYITAGWTICGCRRNYYGADLDASILRKDLV